MDNLKPEHFHNLDDGTSLRVATRGESFFVLDREGKKKSKGFRSFEEASDALTRLAMTSESLYAIDGLKSEVARLEKRGTTSDLEEMREQLVKVLDQLGDIGT